MAASTPLTPLLHRRRASIGGHRRGGARAFVVVVAAAAAGGGGTPDAEPSPAAAAAGQGKKKTVDTRIHWSDPDEGWVGGNAKKGGGDGGGGRKKEPFGARFADLINNPSESHYQFLGVEAKADIEEIKAAYRRLSKEYHPDTTALPLKAASERFIRLREAYNVLSREESRRFYDWTLAQEAESRRLQQLRSRLEDPYEQDIQNYQSVPDMVDRLGGKNMKLSDQAMTALTIDIAIIIFCVLCLIYAVFFKEQY
ncbi:NAD(P)H-quinone oxidoreductase subunit T, chloroplastic [Oryza brachyantha]|uniref:J domain-containing protein n=1 Tax=Oryza brachyantha TaxID=4533 RepID=J3N6V2_ORYBR|nr:NAD(P)H-quinone oxidoreductase subunit T, chloroplastic [Oryza brachyantha]